MTVSAPYYGENTVMRTPPPDLPSPTGRMVFGKLLNNPESNKSFKSPATQG